MDSIISALDRGPLDNKLSIEAVALLSKGLAEINASAQLRYFPASTTVNYSVTLACFGTPCRNFEQPSLLRLIQASIKCFEKSPAQGNYVIVVACIEKAK